MILSNITKKQHQSENYVPNLDGNYEVICFVDILLTCHLCGLTSFGKHVSVNKCEERGAACHVLFIGEPCPDITICVSVTTTQHSALAVE